MYIQISFHYVKDLHLSRAYSKYKCCKTLIFILQNCNHALNHFNQCFIQKLSMLRLALVSLRQHSLSSVREQGTDNHMKRGKGLEDEVKSFFDFRSIMLVMNCPSHLLKR